MIAIGIVALVSWLGVQLWRRYTRVTADARLAVVNPAGRFSVLGAPEIGSQWKNFGTASPGILTLWVVATDPGMSNTVVCFGDSASPIPPGKTGDFWVEISPTNHIPPWPELVIVLEARYEPHLNSSLGQTQRWVGILGTNAESRAYKTVMFEPLHGADRERYLSNSARLIHAKTTAGPN